MSDRIRTRKITEGSTTLVVPEDEEPSKYPSFFNQKGKFVRDISIACYRAYSADKGNDMNFADSMSGSGARGIRVANEVGKFNVILNDISPTSIDLAKQSAFLNSVLEKCKFSVREVCSFLSTRSEIADERFDAVDLDPFGTPSPFVECVLRSLKDGGLLSVSATDSGVLCGVYPKVTLRKYLGLPLRTEYAHEVGMRLVFGLLSMTAMRMEVSIEPLFCHRDMHYFRTYSRLIVGNRSSKENEKQIGFILHCFRCGYRSVIPRDTFFQAAKPTFEQCPECKSPKLSIGGPMWIGNLQSEVFLQKCREVSKLPIFAHELDLPTYYDLSEITDVMAIRTPKIIDVVSKLTSVGHSASRTRLNPRAIRTDASLSEIRGVLKELSL